MMSSVKESLKENDIIGLVIPDMDYDEILIKVADALSKDYNKILYININKPYEKLMGKFKQNKINTDKFYFIDCITRTTKDVSKTKNCYFVSSPGALDEIQTTILDVIRKYEIDAVLIDSPSSLVMYYEHMDVLKFMHLLTTKLIFMNCKGVFPFPKESVGSLRRSIEMFVDETVHLSLSGGGSSSNVKHSMNLSSNFDKMILYFGRIAWNIQFVLMEIKNKARIFS